MNGYFRQPNNNSTAGDYSNTNNVSSIMAEAKPKNHPNKFNQIEETPFIDVFQPTNPSNLENSDQQDRPSCTQNLSYYFSQYCGATSIHGVQYIGERGRFLIEKIVWAVVITVVWYFCISLILKAYDKWVTSPVIVTFATTEMPIYKIPFPAVTVCPEVKCDPQIFNYTDVYLRKYANDSTITDKENEYFESLSLVCKNMEEVAPELATKPNRLTVEDSTVEDLVKVISDETLGSPDDDIDAEFTIEWLGHKLDNPLSALSATFTNEGVCASFNMVEYSEILVQPEEYITSNPKKGSKMNHWTLEDGYPDSNNTESFPRRTFVSGMNGGLSLTMFTKHNQLDYMCGIGFQGFKVTLHHPSEFPSMDQHFRVPLDQAVLVAIKPKMITVSESLKGYKPEDRKCYFSHERPLMYFRGYTQQNCLDECLSNYTLKQCNCVAFYMPKFTLDPICGSGSRNCLESSKVKYISGDHCNCLPSCMSLEYDVEISQTDWNWREVFTVLNRVGLNFKHHGFDYDNTHVSQVNVYYKEMQFLTSERNELYGVVDFFSNTGGLLGLFIGFSVTSAIEIIYFLTLRLACNIRRFGRVFWSGESELINLKKD